MVYALKLLILVMVVAILASYCARPGFRDLLNGKPYQRAWRIVFAAVAIAYLSLHAALFFVGVAALAFVAGRVLGNDIRGRLAAFMLLLVVFPPVTWTVDGVGGISKVLTLDHMRVLSIVLLLPSAIQLFFRQRGREGNPFRLVDIFILGYQVLGLVQLAPHSTFTGLIRVAVEGLLGILLPYYVTTRGLKSMSDIRFVGVHFMLGMVFAASVAAMETALQRNAYTPLEGVYGVLWQATYRLMRGGLLRVQSITPQPIILAFLLIVGYGVWTWLSGSRWRQRSTFAVYVLFTVSLLATFSRGPWLGALVFFFSIALLRWVPPRVYALGLVAMLLAGIAIKSSGADQEILDSLQNMLGASKEDFGTIEYRRLLLDTALGLIKQSPVWGVPNYMDYMQDLRQGEGIIDFVNTYLLVTLNSGVVGLTLFIMPQVIVIIRILGRLGHANETPESRRFLKAMLSLLVATSLVLITTSSFYVIPYLMIFLIATPLAYLRMSPEDRREETPAPIVTVPRPGMPIGLVRY